MAYNVYYSCEKCDTIRSWVNGGPKFNSAVRIARKAGWQVGKLGWFCPKCRTRKKRGAGDA